MSEALLAQGSKAPFFADVPAVEDCDGGSLVSAAQVADSIPRAPQTTAIGERTGVAESLARKLAHQDNPESSQAAPPLGLYVHVPFCASTCDFCAFYQVRPTAADVRDYFAALEAEAALVQWPRAASTVFWGGGTPGLLSPDALRRLGEITRRYCVRREADSGGGFEWTVELAPASVTQARLAALREVGVTRISMGVQSFQPALLAALGRQHSREQVYRAYERIRAAGFASVNLDLMFALPGQTEAEWEADVAEAASLGPDHLSTYCLTFEEDTALWLKLSQGRVKLDTEHEARLYERTWERLAEAGYAQYEVANFARPEHACRHNLNTWAMHEWVGLGPAAASQHGGWRGANIADLRGWAERVRRGGKCGRGERMTEDRLRLTPAQLAEDAFIFGLRMNAGVSLEAWRTRAPEAPWAQVEALAQRLVADGLAVWTERGRRAGGEGVRLCLTNRGRLLADAVGLEMMAAFDAAAT